MGDEKVILSRCLAGFASLLALVAGPSLAVGLGGHELQSYLGQPLRLVVNVIGDEVEGLGCYRAVDARLSWRAGFGGRITTCRPEACSLPFRSAKIRWRS